MRHRHPRYLSAAPVLFGLYGAAWGLQRSARQALLNSPDEVAQLAERERLPVLADDPAIRAACTARGVELVEPQKRGSACR